MYIMYMNFKISYKIYTHTNQLKIIIQKLTIFRFI